MSLQTRRPTGKPAWPILLVAGQEKAGKSYAAAAASASEHIGRTLWIGIGEDDPDEYGAIPGADFEIVQHDGTYRDILAAVRDATAEPAVDGKPTLLVVDSVSRLWTLLQDMAQAEADDQARRKAAKYGKAAPIEGEITMNLWNRAAQRWAHFMDAIRAHRGPSILTARLAVVTVMDAQGKPTKEKDRKVEGHKSLPFDVGGIVELDAPGIAHLRGVRSLRFKPDPKKPAERVPFPDFTVETMWQRLGCLDGDLGEREHATAKAAVDWPAKIAEATTREQLKAMWHEAADYPDADYIRESITARVAELGDAETQEQLP